MQITFFAILTTFSLICAPSEQQMIVRRQSGLAEISQYNTLSPRSNNGDPNYGVGNDECTGEDSPIKLPPSKGASTTTPGKETKPVEGTLPPKQAPPSKQGSNATTISVNVPPTLSFGKTFNGDATYYGSAGGGGACGFGGFKASVPGIAIGAHIFGQGEACGACVRLNPGKHGKPVIVQVDNKCPECGDGTDLSTEAWNSMTSESPTRFPISWEFVPCGLQQPIEIEWVSKENLYDARFNFRQVSGSILKIEISLGADQWIELQHKDNTSTSYVPVQQGEDHALLEQSTFTIRLTNVKGEQIKCADLNAASWQGKGTDGNWLTCPDSGFQFSTT